MLKFILMSNFLNSEKHEETIHSCENWVCGKFLGWCKKLWPNWSVVALSPGPNSRRWHHPTQHKATHQTPAWDVLQTAQGGTRGRGKAVPKVHARPLQWTPLPAIYPWDFPYDNKERDIRLSEDFPNGMYSVPIHQSSSSVLVCQGIMPATE